MVVVGVVSSFKHLFTKLWISGRSSSLANSYSMGDLFDMSIGSGHGNTDNHLLLAEVFCFLGGGFSTTVV